MKTLRFYQISLLVLGLSNLLLVWQLSRTSSRQNRENRQSISDISLKLNSLSASPNEKVISALTALQDELVRYRAENQISTDTNLSQSIDEALATITDPSVVNPYEPLVKVVKLKPQWQDIDVYQNPQPGSQIIGQLLANQSYIIEDQKTNWFKLRLDSQKSGWVQSQFLNEIN